MSAAAHPLIDTLAAPAFCRSPNIPQYLREYVGVFADRLNLLFAVKWLVIVRRTVLPPIDAMQCMAPDNLHTAGLERTADQQHGALACTR